MITGIGIDMVEVERILEKINKPHGFREKVFSATEINYCEAQVSKGEHYAARFAAKEAFLKAIGLGLMAGNNLADIEVSHDENGKPVLVPGGDFKNKGRWTKIHLTMTHLKSVASAVVIIEQ